MAYNFKSIADVEVVAEPTESANVLIEENGIIKKAPKTVVGGGGGCDAVILLTRDPDNEWDTLTLESGSHAEIYEKLMAGEVVSAVYKEKYISGYDVAGVRFIAQSLCASSESIENSDIVFSFLRSDGEIYNFVLTATDEVSWG